MSIFSQCTRGCGFQSQGHLRTSLCLLVFFTMTVLVGCSTSSRTHLADNFSANALYSFVVEPAVDQSNFKPGLTDSQIDVATAMTLALNDAVRVNGLSGIGLPGALRLQTTISVYAPGNAAVRQFLPGISGSTELTTTTLVRTANGTNLARIEVSRSIGAGGAFTIGAWRAVFDEVAKEIIVQIRSRLLDSRQAQEKTVR